MPSKGQVEDHVQEVDDVVKVKVQVVVNQVAMVLNEVLDVQVVEEVEVVVNQVDQLLGHVQVSWAQCQDEVAQRWAPPHRCRSLVCSAQPS